MYDVDGMKVCHSSFVCHLLSVGKCESFLLVVNY